MSLRQLVVLRYRPEHALAIETIPNEPGIRSHPRFAQWAATHGGYGPGYTFMHQGRIIACAGVTLYWPGVGEVWATFSEWLHEYQKEVVILTGRVLDDLQAAGCLWRMQCVVAADNEVGRRYVEHFGFESEGVMRRYDPLGRDAVMYARIREEYRDEPR